MLWFKKDNPHKAIEWVLRIAVAGEFLGHGIFALQQKASWIPYFESVGISAGNAPGLMTLIGLMDILMVLLVLFWPIRIAILWMAVWGFWTALLRWVAGEPIWDFVERWANWGAPLALLMLRGWPKKRSDWFR